MLTTYQKTKLRGYLCMKYSSVKHIDKKVQKCIEDLIYDYCRTKKYKLVRIEVGNECTRLIMDYPQTIAVVEMIKSIKSFTSRAVRETFPDTLGKQKSFWINSRSLTDGRTGYIFVSLGPYETLDPDEAQQSQLVLDGLSCV